MAQVERVQAVGTVKTSDAARALHLLDRALHLLDRALLHIAEFFFGPRDSWQWWQRKLRKAGLLDD